MAVDSAGPFMETRDGPVAPEMFLNWEYCNGIYFLKSKNDIKIVEALHDPVFKAYHATRMRRQFVMGQNPARPASGYYFAEAGTDASWFRATKCHVNYLEIVPHDVTIFAFDGGKSNGRTLLSKHQRSVERSRHLATQRSKPLKCVTEDTAAWRNETDIPQSEINCEWTWHSGVAFAPVCTSYGPSIPSKYYVPESRVMVDRRNGTMTFYNVHTKQMEDLIVRRPKKQEKQAEDGENILKTSEPWFEAGLENVYSSKRKLKLD